MKTIKELESEIINLKKKAGYIKTRGRPKKYKKGWIEMDSELFIITLNYGKLEALKDVIKLIDDELKEYSCKALEILKQKIQEGENKTTNENEKIL